MATHHSTPAAAPARLPYFTLCEKSGRYQARRKLTTEQIIRAAKAALAHQFARGTVLTSPEVAKTYLTLHYSTRPAEAFVVLFLDNKHRVIRLEELFRGTINGASVHPREVARRCLDLNAAAVILAHNHPSGVVEPSKEDQRITDLLSKVLKLFDVDVLDHLIIGGGTSYSFTENGML